MLINFKNEAYRAPTRPVDVERYTELVSRYDVLDVQLKDAVESKQHHATITALRKRRREAAAAVSAEPLVWQWRKTRDAIERHISHHMLLRSGQLLNEKSTTGRDPTSVCEDLLVATILRRMQDHIFSGSVHAYDEPIQGEGPFVEVVHLMNLTERAVRYIADNRNSSIMGPSYSRATADLAVELSAVLRAMTADCLRYLASGSVVEE